MKFFGVGFLFSVYAQLLAVLVSAQAEAEAEENVVISFPDDTPSSLLQHAMDLITDAGGIITHEYSKYSVTHDISNRGFAATAPEYVLSSITTLSPDYKPVIEKDGIVSINDGRDWPEDEDEDEHENEDDEHSEGVSGQAFFFSLSLPHPTVRGTALTGCPGLSGFCSGTGMMKPTVLTCSGTPTATVLRAPAADQSTTTQLLPHVAMGMMTVLLQFLVQMYRRSRQ
ncbi:hypothetical protein KEM56_006505 [Ascosphaera pollenicola]|nr:hypothetical protein KEM56_006505 [Ascosphaera pollenicola]